MARITSFLEVCDVLTGERTVLAEFPGRIEAPFWSKDGTALCYNADGRIWRYTVADGSVSRIDTGTVVHCNNDHVLSPDGMEIAISGCEDGKCGSYIWTVPVTGGQPKKITPDSPSYLHGWAGDTLVYCAMRDALGGDVTAISTKGGEEIRLTRTEGLNDGPEFAPDGETIWFCSTRRGTMQAWTMKKDGTDPRQITADASRNVWFPHISPDGRRVVCISYDAGEVRADDHPADHRVRLHLMNADGTENHVIAELFGGQGTINVNSWHPDSRRIAFVSYRVEP